MNGMKTEEMGSRKKYLAPVVVLLLCLVSLTGAAYAYSSTMTNTGNTVDAGMLSIDLKLNGAGTAVADDAVKPGEDSIVTFTNNYTYNAADIATKKNQIGFELPESAVTVVTYKVNIARETGNTEKVNLTVGTSDLMNKAMFDVSGVAKTVADLYDVKVQVDAGEAAAIAKVGETAEYKTTASNIALGEHIVIITFTKKDGVAAEGFTTVDPFLMSGETPEKKTAEAWITAISGMNFALNFKAEPYVAP